jgi:hypothetical protein
MYRVVVAVAVNRERPAVPAHAPPALRDLLLRCWHEDPAQRPSARDCVTALDALIAGVVARRATLRAPLRRQLSWLGAAQPHHPPPRRAATATDGGSTLVGVGEYARLALFGREDGGGCGDKEEVEEDEEEDEGCGSGSACSSSSSSDGGGGGDSDPPPLGQRRRQRRRRRRRSRHPSPASASSHDVVRAITEMLS